MASWIVHLQLAQTVCRSMPYLDKTAFYLGNIAVDSGKVKEDMTVDPPVTVSHWTNTGKKSDCRYKDFYKQYCQNEQDHFAYSFYLGCVSHLLTDKRWVIDILNPAKRTYAKELMADKRFIQVIKQDWYDQDFLYLRDHPNFEPLQILSRVKNFTNIYLPWFDEDAIQIKIDELLYFYKELPDHLDRRYPYLSSEEMKAFVQRTKNFIIDELEQLKRAD